jgi:hypothetical protein
MSLTINRFAEFRVHTSAYAAIMAHVVPQWRQIDSKDKKEQTKKVYVGNPFGGMILPAACPQVIAAQSP